ncbi:uncharacterized protein LOC142162271 [Nicotiana tabacum]|uniref:Uncharacterized protein LOC142162271 n=1 Tax=Nicotiana tabacum TaxID=4097 RepID=A0AC58RPN2_TOBAC
MKRRIEIFCKKVEREKRYLITTIQSDHGGDFESKAFEDFYNDQGYTHSFSAPRSPQQNGVVERKNRTLQDMLRTMLLDHSLPNHFWAEGVSTTCHILNRCLIRPILKKTPYELWKGRRPNISYFHSFGSKCFIHNNGKSNLGKFDPRSDEGITSGDEDQAQEIQEISESQELTDGFDVVIESTDETSNNLPEHLNESTTHTVRPSEWRSEPEYPQKFIIGDPSKGMKTRRDLKKKANIALISHIKPKKIEEELDQFDKNQVWKLIPKLENVPVIGTKWVFRNKLNKDGKVVRNKAR